MHTILSCLSLLLWSMNVAGAGDIGREEKSSGTVVIRCDDIGMCHTVNQALALRLGLSTENQGSRRCPEASPTTT